MHRRQLFTLPLLGASVGLFTTCGRQRRPWHGAAGRRARLPAGRVTGGLEHPWALAFLPDGRMLVTERDGRLRLVEGGSLIERPVAGVPAVVASGQGGLLDIALHPRFAENGVLYLSYAGATPEGAATHVLRARLDGDRLVDGRVILVGGPGRTGRHFGSRMAFDREGLLYVSLGERGEMDRAQDLSDLVGKIVRITDEGGAAGQSVRRPSRCAARDLLLWRAQPARLGAQPLDRRDLGAGAWPAWRRRGQHPARRRQLWLAGDHPRHRLHLPADRRGQGKPGMEQPRARLGALDRAFGMAFYDGDAFPGWRGSLFVGALKDELLARLELDGDRVVREERLLEGEIGRIRDVRVGPDGLIYLLNDEVRGGGSCRLGSHGAT